MPKMMIVDIGYQSYALTPTQAVTLLVAIEPMREVKRKGYSGPYEFVVPSKDDNGIISHMSLSECREPEPPEPPVTAP